MLRLCGALRQPGALHEPSGDLCSEHEAFCSASPGNCGSCQDMHYSALFTDCCGERTVCTPEQACPPGRVVDREVEFYYEGIGIVTCGLYADFLALAGNYSCEDMGVYADRHLNCCI